MSESTRKFQEQITRTGEYEKWTPFHELAVCGLSPFEEWVAEWFWKLGTERPPAEGGVWAIPYSKMEDRLEKLGIYGTPIGEDMLDLWGRMDRQYCAFWAKRFSDAIDQNRPKGKSGKDGGLDGRIPAA